MLGAFYSFDSDSRNIRHSMSGLIPNRSFQYNSHQDGGGGALVPGLLSYLERVTDKPGEGAHRESVTPMLGLD